ncbi:hypothetical protein AAII07_35730 [Microvirga sp. 0TCS3.31]
MNENGEAISLQSVIEDPSVETNRDILEKLDRLPLNTDEKRTFSVILRPSTGKNWPVNYGISACFFSSTSNAFRSAFEAVAAEWFEGIALTLNTRSSSGSYNICENGAYEVRIGNFSGIGSYSNVGKTRRGGAYTPAGQYNVTLNIDYPGTSGALFRFFVLHETGHMLGIEHEHQNGNSICRFKEAAVYEHYTPLMPGRTEAEKRQAVKVNILNRFYNDNAYFITAYDRNSVMIYYFSTAMYEDNIAAQCAGGQPDHASNQDLSGLETLYKPRVAAPGVASLDDVKALAVDLLNSRLPSEVKADILARALREHPVSQNVIQEQIIKDQTPEQ